MEEYTKGFKITGDYVEDPLFEEMTNMQREVAKALMAEIEHRIECGKCGTPECPNYKPPCDPHTYANGYCTACGAQEVVFCEHCGQEILDEDEEEDW